MKEDFPYTVHCMGSHSLMRHFELGCLGVVKPNSSSIQLKLARWSDLLTVSDFNWLCQYMLMFLIITYCCPELTGVCWKIAGCSSSYIIPVNCYVLLLFIQKYFVLEW